MNKSTYRLCAVVLAVVSLGGCYLGRAPSAKKVANTVNIASIVVGTLSLVSVAGNNDDESGVLSTLSLIPIAIGLVGLGVNYVAGSKPTAATMPIRRPHRPLEQREPREDGEPGDDVRAPCAPCTCACPDALSPAP